MTTRQDFDRPCPSAGHWLTAARLRAYPMILLAVFALAILGYLAASDGLEDPLGKPLGTYFSPFHAAARLALQGEAVSIGRDGSGSLLSTRYIFRGLGVDADTAFRSVSLDYGDSASALLRGRIEGAAMPGGLPVTAVTQAFAGDERAGRGTDGTSLPDRRERLHPDRSR